MRILVVSGNISRKMGGEAVLSYHYIRELAARGHDIHAVTHARVRDEIRQSAIADAATFHFVEDTAIERWIDKAGQKAPPSLRETMFDSLIGLISSSRISRAVRRLESSTTFDVVHQPSPVSPLAPSFLAGLNAPLVIGPMNGAMRFPPAFAAEYSKGSERVVEIARFVARLANIVIPGKRKAARILVANERTRDGLPAGLDPDKIAFLPENGVDLSLWSPSSAGAPATPLFVYVGRLVWWKAIDILIDAFAQTPAPARLLIIGDGAERTKLEQHAADKAPGRIEFSGFLSQQEINSRLNDATALVLPSLRECGGAVILEAFACAKPAIATDWGGPQDYITEENGVLVPPISRTAMVKDLADAMSQLSADPAKATAMGAAARDHVEKHYSWSAKAEQMISIYKDVAAKQ